ncbi:MAG: hypothetical protein HY939_05795 [Gammaproteobacteria bacterium]|nr:hypothetical protein [Gammaproteobacteria bacterium]
MKQNDNFTNYHKDFLDGRYDCVDRIVFNGYFQSGQQGGWFRNWWRDLTGSDETLDNEHLKQMAGSFSRRVHCWASENKIPLIHCAPGERKHQIAEKYLPSDPNYQGLFLILVGKAPGLVWEVTHGSKGVPHLERKKPWPYINHYHFHIIDREWGHIIIKMSGHPPFGVQIILNGHEWVERKARKQTISCEVRKEGNCFVGGSFHAIDKIADTLCQESASGLLAMVSDRWVYSSCLCFALNLEDQERTNFRYQYSCYQLEYSRNLLFTRGSELDSVYQGLIERSRCTLDVNKLKTIFGWKHRPHNLKRNGKPLPDPRIESIVDRSVYNLTVFKVHFSNLTLKIYDKGERVLRIEAVVHNIKDLRCGKSLEKLSIMLEKLQKMVIDFLNVVQAVHVSFIDDGALDYLSQPTQMGGRRLAGVNIEKQRMRIVMESVLALAANPNGFTILELTEQVCKRMGQQEAYSQRQTAYDLCKLRGNHLVERVNRRRLYHLKTPGIRQMAALLILREKVIKPVLAACGKARGGRPPKTIHPLDIHYGNLQQELRATFKTIGIAA